MRKLSPEETWTQFFASSVCDYGCTKHNKGNVKPRTADHRIISPCCASRARKPTTLSDWSLAENFFRRKSPFRPPFRSFHVKKTATASLPEVLPDCVFRLPDGLLNWTAGFAPPYGRTNLPPRKYRKSIGKSIGGPARRFRKRYSEILRTRLFYYS